MFALPAVDAVGWLVHSLTRTAPPQTSLEFAVRKHGFPLRFDQRNARTRSPPGCGFAPARRAGTATRASDCRAVGTSGRDASRPGRRISKRRLKRLAAW